MKKTVLLFLSALFSIHLIAGSDKTVIKKITFSNGMIQIIYDGKKPSYRLSKEKDLTSVMRIENAILENPVDLSIDSSNIKRITARNNNNNLDIKIEASKSMNYSVFEGERVISIKPIALKDSSEDLSDIVKVIPPKTSITVKKQEQSYDIDEILPKHRVDLEFSNADIKTVILQLAQKANLNVIFDSDISGDLSLIHI